MGHPRARSTASIGGQISCNDEPLVLRRAPLGPKRPPALRGAGLTRQPPSSARCLLQRDVIRCGAHSNRKEVESRGKDWFDFNPIVPPFLFGANFKNRAA